MACTAPTTPLLSERMARSSSRNAGNSLAGKENCPPIATPIGKGIAIGEGKTPASSFMTPAGKTGEAPKTLEQWDQILRALPTTTPADRARLERLFERVLGSGSGNEELDVAGHKDQQAYVGLWLYRIALDPDEGTTYTKFMRKWGIGRKYAVVYVQQALVSSEDKVTKVLQEGIDADAQPAALLEELLKSHSKGDDLKQACSLVLKKYPDADSMLNSKQTPASISLAALPASAFSTPAPKTRASAPTPKQTPSLPRRLGAEECQVRGGGCDETIAEEDARSTRGGAGEEEDTVVLGPKLSASKAAPPAAPRHAVASTPTAKASACAGALGAAGKQMTLAAAARVTPARACTSTSATTAATASTSGSSEETVMFGSKLTTTGAPAPAAAAAAPGSESKTTARSNSMRGTASRQVKRTGLGGGPARRVNAAETDAVSDGRDAKEQEQAGALDGKGAKEAECVGVKARGRPLAYEESRAGMRSELGRGDVGDMAPQMNLPPICEQEGRSSGEGAGNTSTSSSETNDSVNRSGTSDDQPRPLSEAETQFVGAGADGHEVLSEMQTQHGGSGGGCVGSCIGEEEEEEQEAAVRREALPRHEALMDGHRPQIPAGEVPKGFIAVCDKLYKKIDVIGKGGGGKVYKVSLEDDDKSVWAIKKIKLEEDQELRACVLNEIELLVALRGERSIIHMKDYEVGPDYVHMVMECGEQDLAQALQRKQVRSLRGVWKAMIDAVQVVHEKRVVHGDLKPANFLMVNKELKLIDFGIAKRIESNDTTNIVRDNAIGTLNYMAPEAFVGNQGPRRGNDGLKLGRQSDIWSLGCILYQMVYGRPPFHAFKNAIQKMQAITNREHKIEFPATGPAGNVEKDLIDVMKRTLERDPARRPTIPELRQHPWLVPPKFGLDSYNILVMVSKIRALHRENPDRSDEDLKEYLITLMKNAGLALPASPAS